jgi:malate dehydrogenase (oxaloacetate-decarboxylating)
MDYAKESLRLHYEWKGKLEMVPRAEVNSKDALSLAYTPGVAQPCLEIQKDVTKSYELTAGGTPWLWSPTAPPCWPGRYRS